MVMTDGFKSPGGGGGSRNQDRTAAADGDERAQPSRTVGFDCLGRGGGWNLQYDKSGFGIMRHGVR